MVTVIVMVVSTAMIVGEVVGLWDSLYHLDAEYLTDPGRHEHLLLCHLSIHFLFVISFCFQNTN